MPQEILETEPEALLYEKSIQDEDVRPMDLSELLREGTKESHDQAQNNTFIQDFLNGHIKWEDFKLFTTVLYFTYSALEEEIERNKEHPAFAPLYFPLELHRTDALVKDLKYLYGEDWKDKIQCSQAMKRYAERIHHVGQQEPELLVAHAYTRYMGDLSGVQVLKKVAQRTLHLSSTGEGSQFYYFDNISSIQQFKQLYRARMNILDVDNSTKAQIVEESKKAYQFNMQVFDEFYKIGSKKEVQNGGLPVHDGKGDIRKNPYYAAKQGAGETSGCSFHVAMAVCRHPTVQFLIAAAAGVLFWYLM
ncbi:heme oxygenase 2 [Microcaecilia unicolor]|uniref:heme oxygenase (biliverdin-producing) n=1 Tax=Microcaecilia unicolor TaxID=1415580 RepID=A0A6P7YID3_9AMPH|nr:heme oxygenase 2-like [Microcaecilia unicolor]XP_030067222.1 heme oxygenase 2-like [Microcaecilia unicolor]XP_030067223.1 heme oxygenase 2-like [Microcaecilia unicolor]XP_030067224.1 heme oxygenase 2-like [Microcaecilia unicolor]XP_030067225.1 heme oxygenase 2-like [Microcaecilia unicolor]XP_030067227.1 heme oxygenase 2-like [Microcaecilia unicolor]